MARSMAAVLAAAALITAAACGLEPVESRDQPYAITNGVVHTGHPSVGRLLFSLSGGTAKDGACTATLVGTKTVITAAHCLGYPNTDFVLGAWGYKSVKSIPHPKYNKATSAYLYDVGLVTLSVAPKVTPSKLSIVAPVVGQAVTMIGYGETTKGAGDNNVKRLATNKIATVQPLYFTVAGASGSNGNACYGDSGGPVFVTQSGKEALAGIMSYVTGSCGVNSINTRVQSFTTWLKTSASDLQFLDLVKPTVKITAPVNGATVGTSVQVKVTASDNMGVTLVRMLVDGAQKGALTVAPYTFNLTLAQGTHTLTAIARDKANNQASHAIKVTVPGPDLGPPDAGAKDTGKTADVGGGGDTGGAVDQGPGDTSVVAELGSADLPVSTDQAGSAADGTLDASGGESPAEDDGCNLGDDRRGEAVWLVLPLLMLLRRRKRR